jgi:secreted PhoX family phosphatase
MTPAYLSIVERAGQRAFWVHSLHKQYGPVVRIAPNELSFATAHAAWDIYLEIEVATANVAVTSVKHAQTNAKICTCIISLNR